MIGYGCDLLIAGGFRQYLSWCILCTRNEIVAKEIEKSITPSHMRYIMKAYEILRIAVKTSENLMKIGREIKGLQVKYLAC